MPNFHGNNRDCILYFGAATAISSSLLPSFASEDFTEVGMTGKLKLPVYERSVGRFRVLNSDGSYSLPGNLSDQEVSGDLVLCTDEFGHSDMFDDIDAGNLFRNWQIITPVGETHQFKGFVSKWERSEYDANAEVAPAVIEFIISLDGKPTVSVNTPT